MPKKVWNSSIYTDEDEATLIRMFGEYLSLPDIALALGRSQASVKKKINKLDLKRNYRVVIMVSKYGLDVLDRISIDTGTLVTHCNRGHEFTEKNTFTYKSPNNGRSYRQCRACRTLRTKLAYRNNPAFREKAKLRALKQRSGDVRKDGQT